MREAGKILAAVHQELGEKIRPGMSTMEIDRMGEAMIRGYGCEPSFKNYCGYPASVCVSVNEEVVHGIPSDSRIIEEGDIVSLDAGVIYKGYHSDAARTVAVGEISEEAGLLIRAHQAVLFRGNEKGICRQPPPRYIPGNRRLCKAVRLWRGPRPVRTRNREQPPRGAGDTKLQEIPQRN